MAIEPAWREPCYSNRLVRPFLSYIREQVGASSKLNELSAHEVDARLPIRELLALLDRLVAHTGDADIGLRAAQAMPPGGTGVCHFAAASAATLGEALRLLVRYAPIVNEAAEFELRVDAPVATYVMRSRLPLNRQAADFQVALAVFRIRHWLGDSAVLEAHFRHDAPRDLSVYHAVLPGVTPRFGVGWDAVQFDASLLARPIPGADPELNAVLMKHADELLSRIPESQTLAQRVRATVLALMSDGELDGRRVATRLGMSRRSLTRHLEHEHTSYSELLNEVRRELALQLLRRDDLDVQEIAARLGYSLTAAFSRAFRRWEGMSPMQYRRAHATGGRLPDARLAVARD